MDKPRISSEEAKQILASNNVTDKVAIIGIRGYYLDSYGKRGENDRGVYDDAIIIISARKFETFRANTDPSVYRKGIATLATGVHRYYKGKHKNRYWALRLVGERAPVTRDGQGASIGIALNIHKGGTRTTGSEGCQTLRPDDWDDFIEIVYDEMAFYGQKTIPYVLIDEKQRRAGLFKMPSVAVKEIENLADEILEIEPAAENQAEKLPQPIINQTPAFEPSFNPSAPEFAQPQTSGASTLQPVQKPLETPPTAGADFAAMIPQIDTAKKYLKRTFSGSVCATIAAAALGLPLWIQIALAVLVLVIVIGGIFLFVRYYKDIFAFVTAMNTLRATQGADNPVLTTDKV